MSIAVSDVTVSFLRDGRGDGVLTLARPDLLVQDAEAIVTSSTQPAKVGKIANISGALVTLVDLQTAKPLDLSNYRVGDGATVEMPAQTVTTQSASTVPTVVANGNLAVAGTSLTVNVNNQPQDQYLKLKWLVAVAFPKVHMEVDFEGLTALSPLPNNALQSDANARAEVLRTAMSNHMLGVGTAFADGEHKAADSTNNTTLLAIPAATDLPSCITLINGLHAGDVAHATQSGVHFTNDTSESSDVIPVDPPVTLADCISDLNALKLSFQAHFARGSF